MATRGNGSGQVKYRKGLKLPPQVTGLLGLIELPFPEGCAKDACTTLSAGSCPIEEGETIVYEIDLEVKKRIGDTFPLYLNILNRFDAKVIFWLEVFLNIMRHLRTIGHILHCKKGYRFSRPQPGCHSLNSPWAGKSLNFFYSVESRSLIRL